MRPNVAFGASSAPNVAFGASSAPNVAFGASNAPNATLGRLKPQPGGRRRRPRETALSKSRVPPVRRETYMDAHSRHVLQPNGVSRIVEDFPAGQRGFGCRDTDRCSEP